MPYTDEQLAFFNTKPSNIAKFNTVEFSNIIAGQKRILACGTNGPYKDMVFEGLTYQAVRCEIPDVTTQDTENNSVGQITFSRIGTETRQYLRLINAGIVVPADAVIDVTIRIYQEGITNPIYERKVYVGQNGISIDQENVTVSLQVDNPSKITYIPFYSPDVYTGLVFG